MGELERTITQAEFNEWMYFFSHEPLASEKNEIQMNILLSMLASFMGVKCSQDEFLLSTHLKSKHTQQNNEENLDIKKLQEDVLKFLG
ncbi:MULTISPECIES: phage tail assembly protein T [Campylobacter]|uniref:phage tail assembly protein T n=1 Tax=Campylobacter TaxID=194 RepID=UPI00301C7F04